MLAAKAKPRVPTVRAAPTTMADYMDRMFENLRQEMLAGFSTLPVSFGRAGTERWLPALTDVEDKGNLYEVRTDLPGVKKENIDVRVRGPYIQIEAKESSEKDRQGKSFLSRERTYEGFSRLLDLPEDVLAEKVAARYEDGVLTLTLPKAHPEPEKKVSVT
jgi:HSP20 family protein